jgi:hypothetical protein
MTRATLDIHLDEHLSECPLSRAREVELRRSFRAAWPSFSALAEKALTATIAENETIADEGLEE